MPGVILHSDLNCFYASVEMNEQPWLRGRRVAVCGSAEDRHGIVLTASYPAKRMGVKTGMAIWQAKQSCPELEVVPPHYDLYLRYSRQIRAIYRRYSDDVEPFGMDECWISLPYTGDVDGEGRTVAEELRRIVREETGLTVSVGVSFSKIFAKLGSDMKKPDAVTVITRESFREQVWPLPASDLLYVGRATARRLMKMNIATIGDLARADPELLRRQLGRNGLMLSAFARGEDATPVRPAAYIQPVKSVGHGVTCVRDLDNDYEVWLVLYELAQDVGHRLRVHGLRAKGVSLAVRDNSLCFLSWQVPLAYPSQSPFELADAAFRLFREKYDWACPVRALTVSAISPEDAAAPVQLDMWDDWSRSEKRRAADDAVDSLRRRYGSAAVRSASLLGDLHMAQDRCETVLMPAPMYKGGG